MSHVVIIAAVARDGAIGRGGDLAFHISADLRRFKQLTMGCPVVMGRKTFESFPSGPLPGRRNIVITSAGEGYGREHGVETAGSLEEALGMAMDAPRVFVIGGGQVYRQAVTVADGLDLTEIDAPVDGADTFFPVLDPDLWQLENAGDWETDPRSGARYRFTCYSRKK